MPAHGRRLASRVPRRQLIAALPVPVCVVGGRVYSDGPSESFASRILLALSLHAIRREYVDFACGVAEARRARLTLLHVIDPSAVSHRGRASTYDAARVRLAALAATCDCIPWRPDIAVREGDPAAQIIEQAACPFQDFIVLGSSSLTPSCPGNDRAVIRRVIAEARCPVITLKPRVAKVRTESASDWLNLKTGSFD